jgi:hypothetical protein
MPPSKPERRASVRYRCDLQAVYQPRAPSLDDVWLRARVRDISAGGLSLVTGQAFGPGTVLDVVFDRGLLTFPVRIVHVRRLEDGGWLHGCAFLQDPARTDAEQLLFFHDLQRTVLPDGS